MKSFEEALDETNQLADRLGLGIDDGIKETVAALRMHGFDTTGSCEGHLDHGLAYPWIDIGLSPGYVDVDQPDDPEVTELVCSLQELGAKHKNYHLFINAYDAKKDRRFYFDAHSQDGKYRTDGEVKDAGALIRQNATTRQRIVALLEQYYRGHSAPTSTRIHPNPMGIYGAFRLNSVDASFTKSMAPGEKAAALGTYQAEMRCLGEWLKGRN